MRRRAHYIIIGIAALLCAACAVDSTTEPVTPIAPAGEDPIAFTGSDEGTPAYAPTRAAMLHAGFIVSAYKNFGSTDWNAANNTVMDRFSVAYKESRDDWNGIVISNWNYVDITNPWTANRQEEKFWDLAGFPYRFHAVAPANGNSITKEHISVLSTDALAIHAPFRAQTCNVPSAEATDPASQPTPTITPSNKDAEPYLVAQVSRNANGEDYDIIKNKEINKSATGRNRRVALPFHHLNSKVRFGVYTLNLAQTIHHDYISDLVITVEKLATSASSYKAYGQDAWVEPNGFSFFQGIEVKDNQQILTFNPSVPPTAPDTDAKTFRSYADNDLSLHQGRSSAYFLECADGIMQLPQTGIKLHVSMRVMKEDHTEHFVFHDYEIKQQNEYPNIDPTHWIAGYVHTYYLCLELNDEKLPVLTLTATLTPWEDVTGTLSTDLEK